MSNAIANASVGILYSAGVGTLTSPLEAATSPLVPSVTKCCRESYPSAAITNRAGIVRRKFNDIFARMERVLDSVILNQKSVLIFLREVL